MYSLRIKNRVFEVAFVCVKEGMRKKERERERVREREILKIGISLWHIDKHSVLTAGPRKTGLFVGSINIYVYVPSDTHVRFLLCTRCKSLYNDVSKIIICAQNTIHEHHYVIDE